MKIKGTFDTSNQDLILMLMRKNANDDYESKLITTRRIIMTISVKMILML